MFRIIWFAWLFFLYPVSLVLFIYFPQSNRLVRSFFVRLIYLTPFFFLIIPFLNYFFLYRILKYLFVPLSTQLFLPLFPSLLPFTYFLALPSPDPSLRKIQLHVNIKWISTFFSSVFCFYLKSYLIYYFRDFCWF